MHQKHFEVLESDKITLEKLLLEAQVRWSLFMVFWYFFCPSY
jgi:hypothetical protein